MHVLILIRLGRRRGENKNEKEELRQEEHGKEEIAVTNGSRQKSVTMTSPYDSEPNSPLFYRNRGTAGASMHGSRTRTFSASPHLQKYVNYT